MKRIATLLGVVGLLVTVAAASTAIMRSPLLRTEIRVRFSHYLDTWRR